MSNYQLCFKIFSYWHCGSGRGGGQLVDAVVHKDADGLPELPGRTVKGLLRDAVQRTETWGHLDAGTTELWFGSDTREFDNPSTENPRGNDHPHIDRYQTQAGLLIFDNAVLDQTISAWLRTASAADARLELYRQLHATAIDPQTGAAKAHSLRGMEVVVPLELFAPIATHPAIADRTDSAPWYQRLPQCLPLIRGIGLARNRGLGRCKVTLEVCS